MAQLLQPEHGPPPGQPAVRNPGAEPREPATAAALWPTFMRRTLAEDAVRSAQAPQPDPAPRVA